MTDYAQLGVPNCNVAAPSVIIMTANAPSQITRLKHIIQILLKPHRESKWDRNAFKYDSRKGLINEVYKPHIPGLQDRSVTFQFIVLSQYKLKVVSAENTNPSPTACIQTPSSLNKKQLPTVTLLSTPGGTALPTESHQMNWELSWIQTSINCTRIHRRDGISIVPRATSDALRDPE